MRRRMKPWLAIVALLGSMQAGWAADSKLIEPAVRIDPVLIVATYAIGPCSQETESFWQEPLGFAVDRDKLKQTAPYVFCRNLPQALLQRLLAHHIDAVLREFDTEPLKAREYASRSTAFEQQALNSPENANRYVLQYNGAYFGQNARAGVVISLLSPVNADGKRTHLGNFELDGEVFEMVNASSYSRFATYRLRSPYEVAERLANSMESRCYKKGLFNYSAPCPSSYRLYAP